MTQRPVGVADGKRRRLRSLDILRFLAVLLVLGRHMWVPPLELPSVSRTLLLAWRRGGWVGVDLFFVLSGFLVAGLLFSEYKSRGEIRFGRFFIRRGWKIYPPFYSFIIATIAVLVISHRPPTMRRLLAETLFLQSYTPALWDHTWSLAVEEHFYLLLPCILYLGTRRGAPTRLRLVLGVAIITELACPALRVLNWHNRSSYDHLTHLFATHLRIDSLFFGVLISYWFHFAPSSFFAFARRFRYSLIAVGALILSVAFVINLEVSPAIYTVGFTFFYLASGMILVGALATDMPPNRLLTFIAEIGAHSYSIYLWHLPVLLWGVPFLERLVGLELSFALRLVVYLLGSFVVGMILSRLIEMPALRLRDRLFPRLGNQGIKLSSKQVLAEMA